MKKTIINTKRPNKSIEVSLQEYWNHLLYTTLHNLYRNHIKFIKQKKSWKKKKKLWKLNSLKRIKKKLNNTLRNLHKCINCKTKFQELSLFHQNLILIKKVLPNKNHILKEKDYRKSKLMKKETVILKHYCQRSELQSKKDRKEQNKSNKCKKV